MDTGHTAHCLASESRDGREAQAVMPLFLHLKGGNPSSSITWCATEIIWKVTPLAQIRKSKSGLFQSVSFYSDALLEIPANPASHQTGQRLDSKSMIEFDIPLMHCRLASRPQPPLHSGRWPKFLLSSQRNWQTQTASLTSIPSRK